MVNTPGNIHFVNCNSGDITSVKVQRKVHAHAARAAHARARRLRTIEYQASKAVQKPEPEDQETKPPSCNPLESGNMALPSLLRFLAADRRDPFSCFARAFTPVEHFLLDHCKSSPLDYPAKKNNTSNSSRCQSSYTIHEYQLQ